MSRACGPFQHLEGHASTLAEEAVARVDAFDDVAVGCGMRASPAPSVPLRAAVDAPCRHPLSAQQTTTVLGKRLRVTVDPHWVATFLRSDSTRLDQQGLSIFSVLNIL
jgi:hypothetical protein